MSTGDPSHPFYNYTEEQRQHLLDVAHMGAVKRLFTSIILNKNESVIHKKVSIWYGLCRKVVNFVLKMIKCKGRFTNGSMQ
jgi:hypothetical protein